jgi:hypothetical protein
MGSLITEDLMGRPCSTLEKRNAYRFFMVEKEGKRPPGRYRHRWEDHIKMDLIDRMRRCGLVSSGSGGRVLVNTTMYLLVS